MKAARHFIGVVIKLTASVQHRHDDFGGGNALLMLLCGNTASIVGHRHRLVRVNNHVNLAAMAG